MQRCLAIEGGHTLSRRPKKAAKKVSSVIRERREKTGLGKCAGDTESPDYHAVLGQAARNFAGSWSGSPLQNAFTRFQQGAEKQAELKKRPCHGCVIPWVPGVDESH